MTGRKHLGYLYETSKGSIYVETHLSCLLVVDLPLGGRFVCFFLGTKQQTRGYTSVIDRIWMGDYISINHAHSTQIKCYMYRISTQILPTNVSLFLSLQVRTCSIHGASEKRHQLKTKILLEVGHILNKTFVSFRHVNPKWFENTKNETKHPRFVSESAF